MNLERELTAILGPGKVSVEAEARREHSIDKWLVSSEPEVVVFAESTGDVAAVLRFANENGVPVTPRGAGVGYVGGAVPLRGGISLSLMRMNRILEVSPADSVAVVQPGVITADLQSAARELGRYYPPDPASLKECSIGGNLATNAGGPRCLKYGVTRPYVLGLEAVLADGTVVRAGGRCHKNKQGFDLVGVFVGSEGLLGVVTEATLRLLPLPPARRMLSVGFARFADAAAAVDAVFDAGFLPSALEITDKFTLQAARATTGGDLIPPGDANLMVEFDGQEEAVGLEMDRLARLLEDNFAPKAVLRAEDEAACDAFWEMRRAYSYSLRDTGLVKLNNDVAVPRGRIVDLVRFCEELQNESGMSIACFGHAGDGNIHVNLMVEEITDEANAALDKLFKQVLAWGGVVTGEHGVGIARMPWFEEAIGPGAVELHRRLKKALDPKGTLNPGKFMEF